MNVLWQDNVPSFLDASSLGAGSFAGSLGDVGAPWFASADGGLFSGQPVLWWDNGADSATADSGLTGVAGFDPGGAAGGWLPHGAEAFSGVNPALDGGLLWADPSGSTSNFAPLAPQQLVWTDPTQGLPAIISDPAAVGAAPVTLAGVGLLSQETGILPPISGAGSR